MKAVNIKWDTDGDLELLQELPKEIEIPECLIDKDTDKDEYEEEISDYISDVTGFCHYGFELINNKNEKIVSIGGLDCEHDI